MDLKRAALTGLAGLSLLAGLAACTAPNGGAYYRINTEVIGDVTNGLGARYSDTTAWGCDEAYLTVNGEHQGASFSIAPYGHDAVPVTAKIGDVISGDCASNDRVVFTEDIVR